jgi:hypothetical protein
MVNSGVTGFQLVTLGTAAELNVPASPGTAASSGEVVRGDDPRLAGAHPLLGIISSGTVAVGTGAKTTTITTGLKFPLGMRIWVISSTTPTNWVSGIIDSTGYDAVTGALAFTADTFSGSGSIGAGGIVIPAPNRNPALTPGTYTNCTITIAADGTITAIAAGTNLTRSSTSLSVAANGTTQLQGGDVLGRKVYKLGITSTASWTTADSYTGNGVLAKVLKPQIGSVTAMQDAEIIELKVRNAITPSENIWILLPSTATVTGGAATGNVYSQDGVMYVLLPAGKRALILFEHFGDGEFEINCAVQ